MGAISSTTETDVDLIVETNFRLSRRLWAWCAHTGTTFIYASSAATYGDGSAGFDDDPSLDALVKLRPLNPYGWSKHLFDRMVLREVNSGGPQPKHWAGLKFFNVYGPNEYHKGAMRSVVHQAFEQIQERGSVRLFRSHHPDYQDGGQLRDFIYVADCVDLVLWLMDNPEVCGLYNCGTGEARSFLDLAHAVFAAMGREPSVEYIDTPIEIRDRYQYFTQAESARLRAAGYPTPYTSLEDGVRDYVTRYLDSADPYA
jgi:ADP-L-glycero-D-manno-heptose 6-epimerase